MANTPPPTHQPISGRMHDLAPSSPRFSRRIIVSAAALPWVHPNLELLDEINDAEIYNAVVSSMKDWERRQEMKRISNRLADSDFRGGIVFCDSIMGVQAGWIKWGPWEYRKPKMFEVGSGGWVG